MSDNQDIAKLKTRALALLARREHSALELQNKLQQKGFEPAAVTQIIETLQTANLQSDQRFAEMYYRSKASQGLGPVRIRNELIAKGVCESIIDEVSDELAIDWQEIIKQTYEKKYRGSPISDYQDKMKRMNFLQYRGFEFALISSLIQQYAKNDEFMEND